MSKKRKGFVIFVYGRFELLEEAKDYTDKDGLNSVQYKVTDSVKHACYTKIVVDVIGEKDNRTT